MLFEYLKNCLIKIETNYGVNPVIFAVIYFGGAPFFWWAIYKIIKGVKNNSFNQVRVFGIVLGCTTIAPFVYVAFVGHNVPHWFWLFAGVIIVYTIYSVLRKVRKSHL